MGESRNPAVVAGLLSVSALAAPQVAHGLSLGEAVSEVFTNPALSFSAGLVGGAFLTGAIMGGVLLATMNKREAAADHDDKPASAPTTSEQKPEVEVKAEVKTEAEAVAEVKSETTPKAPAEVRHEKAGAPRHMRTGQPAAEPRDAEEQDARHSHAPSHEAGTYEQIAENYVNKVSFRARMAHRAQGVAATLRERMGANIMDGVPVIERADGTVVDLGASWLQQAVGKSEKSMNFITDTDSFMIPSDFSRTDEERLVERAARAQGISRRVAQIDEGAYPERKNARDLDETDEWIRALNSMDEHIAEQQVASRPASFIDTVGGADTLDEPEGLEPQTSVIPFRTPAGHPEVVDTATYIDYLIEDEISKNPSPSVQRHTRRVLLLLEGGTSSSARLSDTSSEYVPKHFAPLMAAQA